MVLTADVDVNLCVTLADCRDVDTSAVCCGVCIDVNSLCVDCSPP